MMFKGFRGQSRTRFATAALGIGIVAGSLLGVAQVDAAPHGGAGAAASKHYACSCEPQVTTSDLNLRSGPGTNYDILMVIPYGADVQAGLHPDHHVNGFIRVAYGDNYGWASDDYLAEVGTGGPGYPIVDSAFTTDTVNFRQGPGTDYYVQFVLPPGTEVAISNETVAGFRYVQYGSTDGWIYDAYLATDGGGSGGYDQQTMTTTTDLNLRAGGTFDAEVLIVMAEGETVYASDLVVNGFRNVVYGSYEGWAYDEYLL